MAVYGTVEGVQILLNDRVAVDVAGETTYGQGAVAPSSIEKILEEQSAYVDGVLGRIYQLPLISEQPIIISIVEGLTAGYFLPTAHYNSLETNPEGDFGARLMKEAKSRLQQIALQEIILPGEEFLPTPAVPGFGGVMVGKRVATNPYASLGAD